MDIVHTNTRHTPELSIWSFLFNPTRNSIGNASRVAGAPPIKTSLEAILTQVFYHNLDWGTIRTLEKILKLGF